VVAMIAMLEELVKRSGHDKLEALFAEKNWSRIGMGSASAKTALQTYLVRWIMGNDTESVRMLDLNPDLLKDTFEDWNGMVEFVHGCILHFQRSRSAVSQTGAYASSAGDSWHPFRRTFSFADVQELTGDIVLTFGRYWHAECERVKQSLLHLDFSSTGRVKLLDFHRAAAGGEWRFSESREYLRELGALDESSSTLGPRVIIPNYLQSASNCIVGDNHYRVCCANDCESIMTEIEDAVQSPTATVTQLLTSVDDIMGTLDEQASVPELVRSQLMDIAAIHHGNIPIHGRLFAQWLHFVFPQDCPFPHKAGTVSSLTPHEFGTGFIVSAAELATVTTAHDTTTGADEDAHWMTQWTEEEDLVSLNLQAPWEARYFRSSSSVGRCVAVLAGLALSLRWLMEQSTQPAQLGKSTTSLWSKEHYV